MTKKYKRVSKKHRLYFYNDKIYFFDIDREVAISTWSMPFKDAKTFSSINNILLYTDLDKKLYICSIHLHYKPHNLSKIRDNIVKTFIYKYYFYCVDTNNFLYIYKYDDEKVFQEVAHIKIEDVDSVKLNKNKIFFDGQEIKLNEIKNYYKKYFTEIREGVLENTTISKDVFSIILSYL